MEVFHNHDLLQVALHLAVFLAAALQVIVGIGFGLLAGPALLVILDDGSAIQITVILSFLTVLVLLRSLFRLADRKLLLHLLVGTIPGVILGALAFRYIDLSILKPLAGSTVLFMLFLTSDFVARRFSNLLRDSRPGRLTVGGFSGFFTAFLAMPGPPPAAYMLLVGLDMTRMRMTTLALFLWVSPLAFAGQSLASGVSVSTLVTAAALAPATLVGAYLGGRLARSLSPRIFRYLVKLLLLFSGLILFL